MIWGWIPRVSTSGCFLPSSLSSPPGSLPSSGPAAPAPPTSLCIAGASFLLVPFPGSTNSLVLFPPRSLPATVCDIPPPTPPVTSLPRAGQGRRAASVWLPVHSFHLCCSVPAALAGGPGAPAPHTPSSSDSGILSFLSNLFSACWVLPLPPARRGRSLPCRSVPGCLPALRRLPPQARPRFRLQR